MRADSPLANQVLNELQLRRDHGINVIAVERRQRLRTLLLMASGNTQLEPGDVLLVDIASPAIGLLGSYQALGLEPMPLAHSYFSPVSYTHLQPGTDHAGIATQMVVERQLAAQGIGRHDLGREKFLEKVWEWKNQSGGTITRQIRRLGSSVDWSRERFTMDDGLSEAVKEAFVRLHEDGLIYRGKRLVNWDTKFHTAISDLEVENHDEKGSLWNLRYPLADGKKTADGKDYLIVATTRPETMLGDSAVAVHPEDELSLIHI